MLSTPTSPNNIEVPFPYPPDNDATVLHPRVQVAKHMEKLKMSLPSGSKETGLQILQRMAAGDDSWLNSPIRNNEEHLEVPEWIKELLPSQKINEEKRQELNEMMVRSQLEATIAAMKDHQVEVSNASNEGSLLSTEYVEALMPLSTPMTTETPPEVPAQQTNETIVEAPTSFMPALQTPVSATPVIEKLVVPDPVTPIPPALSLGLKSIPDFTKYQEKQSDAFNIKKSHYYITVEKPLDAASAAVLNHRRQHKEAPSWITISEKFVDALRRDVEDTYDGMPLPTHIPHITSSGEVISIPIMINDKLRAAPNSIICFS